MAASSCIKIRWIIVLLTTFCPIVCYISRQNLNIAITAMVNDDDDNEPLTAGMESTRANGTSSSWPSSEAPQVCSQSDAFFAAAVNANNQSTQSYGDKYKWTLDDRSLVLQSFYWTYVIFQLPAARAAEIAGAKYIMLMATCGSSIISLFTPWAASVHVYALVLLRAIMGACQTAVYPACYVLYTRWLPPSERDQALGVLNASAYVGSIVASTATGYFIASPVLGWEFAFYLAAILSGIWSVLWLLLASSDPRDHKLISSYELAYIESTTQKSEVNKRPDWLRLLRSPSVFALSLIMAASSWSFFIMLIQLPTYLSTVLRTPAIPNGYINAGIYLIYCISAPIVGCLSTKLIERQFLGLTRIRVRKLFQSIALFSQGVGLLLLPLAGCNLVTAIIILYVQTVLFSFTVGGEVPIPAELSVDFTGTIYAIGNSWGSSTGFLVPVLHSSMVSNLEDADQWARYFRVSALIPFICGFIFLIFGKNESKDYSQNGLYSSKTRICHTMSESAVSTYGDQLSSISRELSRPRSSRSLPETRHDFVEHL